MNEFIAHRLKIVTGVIGSILVPLGFKNNKLIWRRKVNDVLQQFSLRKSAYGAAYIPDWGVSPASAKLVANTSSMQVSWTHVKVVADPEARMRFRFSLDLDDPRSEAEYEEIERSLKMKAPRKQHITDEERATVVEQFVREYVIQSFQLCDSVEAIGRAKEWSPRFPAIIRRPFPAA